MTELVCEGHVVMVDFNATIPAGHTHTAKEGRPARSTRLLRRHSWFDPVLAELDVALQVLGGGVTASRPNPAGPLQVCEEVILDDAARRHAAGLMRVNHVGEVCAQALYRGQAAASRNRDNAEFFLEAAAQEVDHLGWCAQRLKELDSRPSLLNPLWYAGSFALGALASRAGEQRSLGFMAETERQVEAHLESHLTDLPVADTRSREIVEKMKQDEVQHRVSAENRGAEELPAPVRTAMRLMARVMTSTAYKI